MTTLDLLDTIASNAPTNELCRSTYGLLRSWAHTHPARLYAAVTELVQTATDTGDVIDAVSRYDMARAHDAQTVQLYVGQVYWFFNPQHHRPEQTRIRRSNGHAALCVDPDTGTGGRRIDLTQLYDSRDMAEVCEYVLNHNRIWAMLQQMTSPETILTFPLSHDVANDNNSYWAYTRRISDVFGVNVTT